MMYSTREIRWFMRKPEKSIIKWFASQGEKFETTETRVDYYLPGGKKDLTIKLREGNVEVKERISKPAKSILSGNNKGYFENWVKWSFDANDRSQLIHEIIKEKKFRWTKTTKWRLGKKLSPDKNGSWRIYNIKKELDFGCQVEYTRIKIKNRLYYSFAFEWFGGKSLPLPDEILNELLSGCAFRLNESMGYGQFLLQEAD